MEKSARAKSKAAKIINIISMALLGLCAVVLVYTTVSYSTSGIVNFFGYSFHVIQSESMEPDIKVGDLVIVKGVPYDQIGIGDDILFKCEDTTSQVYGRYVVHRVKEFTDTEGVYITYGINNGGIADKVPSRAEGKVVSVNSGFGGVFAFLTNWRNVLIVIALLGLVGFTVLQACSVVANAAKVRAEKEKEKLQNDEQLKEQLKNELLNEIKQENTGTNIKDNQVEQDHKEQEQSGGDKL